SDRAWPLPKQPWVMQMTWSELLFVHWAVEPEAVASLLPAGVTLDTRDGKAWVGDGSLLALQREPQGLLVSRRDRSSAVVAGAGRLHRASQHDGQSARF